MLFVLLVVVVEFLACRVILPCLSMTDVKLLSAQIRGLAMSINEIKSIVQVTYLLERLRIKILHATGGNPRTGQKNELVECC